LIDLGYIFTFILTAFTAVTTILPFLTQSSETNNPDIYRFQALYTLLNRSSSPHPGDILSAKVTLHEDVQNQTTSKDPEVNLPLAALYYNNYTTARAEDLINHIQCGNITHTFHCSEKVWYFHRLLDINKAHRLMDINNNVVHEDRNCNKTKWNCTQKELVDIDNDISSLKKSGYTLQFYNDSSPVDFLEKPLTTFVTDLHSLIIISLIIVFIVLIFWRTKISTLFAR
jgi:hypothetical protein